MDAQLRALAAGTRRQILALIWQEEHTANDIAAAFAMTRPAISQHLRVLRESHLISVRRAGTRRFYRVNHAAMTQLQAELASFWGGGLTRLKRAAEQAERRRKSP